jgi:intracellular septation protein
MLILVGYDTRMNQLLEWSPLIVFFVAFKLLGLYWATGALMLVSVASLLILRARTGRFKPIHVVTTVIIVILGSATLLFHDKRFIQWKPTVLLGAAAIAFFGSNFIGKQPLARRMLEGVFSEPVELSAYGWRVINTLWAAWLALLATTNIYIARNFAEGVWVNFKVFGISLLMMIFMIPQVVWLSSKTKAASTENAT